MTEIIYRGYRIERNSMGMWEGRPARGLGGHGVGPYATEYELQHQIDCYRSATDPRPGGSDYFSHGTHGFGGGPGYSRKSSTDAAFFASLNDFPPRPPNEGALDITAPYMDFGPQEKRIIEAMSHGDPNPVVTALRNPFVWLLAAACWAPVIALGWVAYNALAR